MSDLKPCPFCGGSVNWCVCGNCPQITCPKCGQFDLVKAGETLEGAKQEAETTWNNRPVEQRLDAAEAKLPKWIPVSERLPKSNGDYLISTKHIVTDAEFEGGEFYEALGMGVTKIKGVLAWQELQEVYKPK